MLTKVLLSIISLLVLIIIIEVVYLQVYLPNKQEADASLEVNDSPVLIVNRLNNPSQAINDKSLAQWYTSLRWFKKDVMTSSVLTNKFAGTISRINKEGRVFESNEGDYDNIPYDKSITLKGSEGNENWFFFTKDSLSKTTVFEEDTSGNRTEITFDDLNVNDSVYMEGSISLTDEFESSNKEFIIIRNKQ